MSRRTVNAKNGIIDVKKYFKYTPSCVLERKIKYPSRECVGKYSKFGGKGHLPNGNVPLDLARAV